MKIGVYICYDRHFPEGARALGLNGAEIVFNPSATVAGLSEYLWKLEQPAHAVANGYFVGAINRVGTEAPWNIGQFYGTSYFCNPRGKIIAEASRDKDEVLIADLDLDQIKGSPPDLAVFPRSPPRCLRRSGEGLTHGQHRPSTFARGVRGSASRRFIRRFEPQAATVEATRCLFCFDAPCTVACPTHIDVPRFIKKISTGNLRGSAMTILDSNILGLSCSRVCPVDVLCEGACVMHRYNKQPIEIGRLQRHAMDYFYSHNPILAGRENRQPAAAWPASAPDPHLLPAPRNSAAAVSASPSSTRIRSPAA